jgi:hypothetical protein
MHRSAVPSAKGARIFLLPHEPDASRIFCFSFASLFSRLRWQNHASLSLLAPISLALDVNRLRKKMAERTSSFGRFNRF